MAMEKPTQLCCRSSVLRVVLILGSLCLITSYVSAEGGLITKEKVYNASGSPYTITEDIVVEKGATLNIEAGVTMRFDPGVGVTVRGVMKAKGTPDSGILLTSVVPPSVPLTMPELRLVDGARPTQGRLQIFYNNKWRSICSNSKNYTAVRLESKTVSLSLANRSS
ncbi:C-type lectin domain-containing protein bark beetle [Oratosquilla oratoria]|uniref:C-type lectin domain-containing protein bark beetle n=1 Tax=Oratosquilla oratoria TaxID=337810 RepID=UPI003F768507